jgi:hypothetical protein
MVFDPPPADEIRHVLRAWAAIEVLTPGKVEEGGWNAYAQAQTGQILNRLTDAQGGRALWEAPSDDDPAPWSAVPTEDGDHAKVADARLPFGEGRDPVEPNQSAFTATRSQRQDSRPWYKVILSAMPAGEAMKRLDAVFDDRPDDDMVQRKERGHIFAATLILDEFGIIVPDSLSIASFAWGLGKLVAEGERADLSAWMDVEDDLLREVATWLSPTDPEGNLRPLLWRDVRDASRELQRRLGLPDELWVDTPCAVRIIRRNAPDGELLSTFYLADITRIERHLPGLPSAARAYLGLDHPHSRWDALNDRQRLTELLDPALFPLARWPGPGLHPLSLLQQSAVNACVRDLAHGGLFAINGPPGTGKTTLLRDIVANVLVSRAERLAAIDDPSTGIDDIDLMDYAIVVASNNNTAVENISLELPVRKKALDSSIWKDADLTYFAHSANHVLGLGPQTPEADQAWGLMAAKLGSAANRHEFFQRFWHDKDWGLSEWLDRAWSPRQRRFEGREPSLLCRLDPPPAPHEAKARWRKARAEFRDALERSRRLRAGLEEIAQSQDRRRLLEAGRPGLVDGIAAIEDEHRDAARALDVAESRCRDVRAAEDRERAMLAALQGTKPGFVARLFGTRAWQGYQQSVRDRLTESDRRGRAAADAYRDRDVALAVVEALDARIHAGRQALMDLDAQLGAIAAKLEIAQADPDRAVPAPGFWAQSEHDLQTAAPWNAGEFRSARDALFAAAVRLHQAFVTAGVQAIKPALNAVIGAHRGTPATAKEWGLFFLLVPVVSTTFASLARMFPTLEEGSIGWLLLDEAGQACPQHALGAIWRARRAVVIGDPLQIPPVVPLGENMTARIFASQGIAAEGWSAPDHSAQSLADRASRIQGRFPAIDGNPEKPRVTGFPLLVHRRCDDPMFGISNRIGYGNRMIHATIDGESPVRSLLGGSAWIDVDGPSKGKWVEDEGLVVDRALRLILQAGNGLPDLYVISPFRDPVRNLKKLLKGRDGALAGMAGAGDWIERHVGTIHTFQGKEAEGVILLLGAGRGAKAGSRAWAGQTPNMLNVAVTRAKRCFYIVGNRTLWKGAGFFTQAADCLPAIDADSWALSQQ